DARNAGEHLALVDPGDLTEPHTRAVTAGYGDVLEAEHVHPVVARELDGEGELLTLHANDAPATDSSRADDRRVDLADEVAGGEPVHREPRAVGADDQFRRPVARETLTRRVGVHLRDPGKPRQA